MRTSFTFWNETSKSNQLIFKSICTQVISQHVVSARHRKHGFERLLRTRSVDRRNSIRSVLQNKIYTRLKNRPIMNTRRHFDVYRNDFVSRMCAPTYSPLVKRAKCVLNIATQTCRNACRSNTCPLINYLLRYILTSSATKNYYCLSRRRNRFLQWSTPWLGPKPFRLLISPTLQSRALCIQSRSHASAWSSSYT